MCCYSVFRVRLVWTEREADLELRDNQWVLFLCSADTGFFFIIFFINTSLLTILGTSWAPWCARTQRCKRRSSKNCFSICFSKCLKSLSVTFSFIVLVDFCHNCASWKCLVKDFDPCLQLYESVCSHFKSILLVGFSPVDSVMLAQCLTCSWKLQEPILGVEMVYEALSALVKWQRVSTVY